MAFTSSDSNETGIASNSSESSGWMYEAAAIAAYAMVDCGIPSSAKKPRKVPKETGFQWVQRQLSDPESCYDMFRMRRSVFFSLHEVLVNNYGLASSDEMCSIEALGMFLWMCGAPQSVRQAKHIFTHSLETISRRFNDVLESVHILAADNIKPKDPSFAVVHPKIREHRSWPHFKNCIGAIDGTHIEVTVPASEQAVHMNRHGYCSQNVMAVCDFDMRFTFVVAGWPGSAHDTRIWRDTLYGKYKDKFPHPPQGKFYLVDSGYPNRKGYLAPYKGQRYHIPEFQNAGQPIGLKEVFNHAHSSLRNVIERSFGVLKMKWRILRNVPSYPMEKQTMIIIACMALHNFIRESNLSDVDFDRMAADETYIDEDGDMGASTSQFVDEEDMEDVRDVIAQALMGGY
jgi:hypothetical protein